jgi:hypothetical protein
LSVFTASCASRAKYDDPARQSVIVVGDGKAVGEQLKEFATFKLQR